MSQSPRSLSGKTVLITGASSGIGYAIAEQCAQQGAQLILTARRTDRLAKLAEQLAREHSVKIQCLKLDVTQSGSVASVIEEIRAKAGSLDVLVNNAGLALGVDPISEGKEDEWQTVLDTNVMGVLRMTRGVLRELFSTERGLHIVNLGSVAGFMVYEGGAVYCASKYALQAITRTLRLEVLGKPIRVTSVDPGMVETEFSDVRFHGDRARAKQVYQGLNPLRAGDIADCVLFALTRPKHVNIDQMWVAPRDQALLKFHRTP
jgi:NADP-dependent 3-hydroxy acid dehydrogenase YdfG